MKIIKTNIEKKEKFYKKIFTIIVVICFFVLSFPQVVSSQGFNGDTKSYGFIISYESDGNYIIIDQKNCRIRHMVNDLLRENIQVYWTIENITVNITRMYSEFSNESRLFERGSFIIPFTGDFIDDNKIISIVYDYNKTSEIETNNFQPIPIYILLEKY